MVRRKFDRILVWDVSRLGRSLQHLIEFLSDLQAVGCDLYIHQQGLDTSTVTGRMMFQMVGVFAEFERSMISDRVKLGLDRVRKSGKRLGPPIKINDTLKQQIWDLSDDGLGLKAITESKSQYHVQLFIRFYKQADNSRTYEVRYFLGVYSMDYKEFVSPGDNSITLSVDLANDIKEKFSRTERTDLIYFFWLLVSDRSTSTRQPNVTPTSLVRGTKSRNLTISTGLSLTSPNTHLLVRLWVGWVLKWTLTDICRNCLYR